MSETGISVDGYEPKHLSYSTIDGFRTCGKRFQLQKVIGVEQRPGLAALGGNAVHSATEWFDTDPKPELFDVDDSFRRAWDLEVANRREQSPSYEVSDYVATGRAPAAYGGKRNEAWWLDHGPAMVQKWIDWRAENDWAIWETPEGKPAVELELNVKLPSGKPVKMFIDRVMVTPVGQLTVVDLKSGRIPETAEQLGLYAYGIGVEYGEMFKPDWGYFWNPDKGHGSPLDLSLYTGEYLDDIAAGAVRGINASVFLAKPANNCRSWCSVSHFCPAVGGTMPTFLTNK